MSQPAYATGAIQTAQVAVGASPVKVGSGASGVPLANRVLWRGSSPDPEVTVYIGPAGVNVSTGFPLATGVDALRAYGPGIDIWAVAAANTTLYVEEVS